MGGCSYDRDVYASSSASGWGSFVAGSVLKAKTLVEDMEPCNKIIESKSKHPIVILLDVTGSNTDFAKIVYDKMPMFYGQIEQKGYLKDFDISVCAVGDASSDKFPLQIANFSKGIEIDKWLAKLVLEGGGGGERCETYELAAYYLLKNFKFRPDAEPIIFFLGDEAPYDTVAKSHISNFVSSNENPEEDIPTKDVFNELLEKIPNTYVFLNPYQGILMDEKIIETWKSLFEDKNHVVTMQKNNEKAIIDLLLGVIAMIGETSLDNYKVDMLDRGQSQDRIESVKNMLKPLNEAMVPTKTINSLSNNSRPRENKSERL